MTFVVLMVCEGACSYMKHVAPPSKLLSAMFDREFI